MPTRACPVCSQPIARPYEVPRAGVCCSRCGFVFNATAVFGATTTPPPPAAGPLAAPLLTANHHCQHCDASLPDPVHRRAATVDCPACHHRTSVYAINHLCPACGRLLESPGGDAGHRVECPACLERLTVPDDVLQKEPPSHSDEYRLAFSCPICTNDVVARRADAGRYAVCPHCAAAFDVPLGGRSLQPVAVAAPDPLHTTKTRTCPTCHNRVPVSLTVCPVCQTRPRLTELW